MHDVLGSVLMDSHVGALAPSLLHPHPRTLPPTRRPCEEHAANTGVGITANSTFLFVTTDGYDGCPDADATCGTNAFTLGYLFKDYFGAVSAMGMDQGGSTTMWIAGAPGNGIVSESSNGGGVPRNVFNGLFLVAE